MKKGLLIAGAALMGGGGLGTVGLIAWFVYTFRREPEHIGIIGGADAPTAIFLADRFGVQLICVLAPLLLCTLVGAGLLAAAIIMHLIRKDPEA